MKPKHLISVTQNDAPEVLKKPAFKPQNKVKSPRKVRKDLFDSEQMAEEVHRTQTKHREAQKTKPSHQFSRLDELTLKIRDLLLSLSFTRVWSRRGFIAVVAVFVLVTATNFFMERQAISLYQDASSYHAAESYRAAVKKYSAFIKRFPKHTNLQAALYYRAGALEMLGKDELAIKEHENLIKKYPASQKASYAYYGLASLLLQKGALERSTHLFQVALNEYPDSSIVIDLWRGLAKAHQKNRRFESAIEAYKSVVIASRGLTTGYEHFQMGLCYLAISKPEVAKQMFKHIELNKIADPRYVEQARLQRHELKKVRKVGKKVLSQEVRTQEAPQKTERQVKKVSEPFTIQNAEVTQRANLRRVKGAAQSTELSQVLEALKEELKNAEQSVVLKSQDDFLKDIEEITTLSLDSLEDNLKAL